MMLATLRNLLLGTLRRRLIFSVAAIQALLMMVFIADLAHRHGALLVQRQTEQIAASVNSLAAVSSGLMATKDIIGLQELVEAQRLYPGLQYAMFLDESGQVLAHTESARVGQYLPDVPPPAPGAQVVQKGTLLEGRAPVTIPNHYLGWILIGIDQRAAQGRLADITRDGVLYSFVAIVLGSCLAWVLGTRVSRRLSALQSAMHAIREGNTHARSKVAGTDEVADLSVGFNSMLDQLEQRESQLFHSNQSLSESEDRFNTAFQFSPVALAITTFEQDQFLATNTAFESVHGYALKDLEARNSSEVGLWVNPEDRAKILALLKTGQPVRSYETQIRHKDGSLRWVSYSGQLVTIKGSPCLLSASMDITGRREAQEALQESKALTEAVLENVPLMIFLKDATDLKFLLFNRAGEELLGADRKDLLGRNDQDLFPPEQAAHFMAMDRKVLEGELTLLDIPEEPILTARYGQRVLHTRKVCIRGANGVTKYLLGISEDITERKQIENSLLANEQTLQNVLANFPGVVFWKDTESNYLGCNHSFALAAGLTSSAEIIQKSDFDLPWGAAEAEKYRADDREIMESGKSKLHLVETQHQATGGLVWFDTSKIPLRDREGRVTGLLGVSTDISELKRTEEALRESEALLRAITDAVPEAIFLKGLDGRYVFSNSTMLQVLGKTREQLLGKTDAEISDDPAVVAALTEADQRILGNGYGEMVEEVIPGPQGSRTYLFNKAPYLDAAGAVVGLIGSASDITARKQAAEDRFKLQAQLEQTQKMESLGSLAGGIAHDMNNVLGAILGLATAHLELQPVGSPAFRAFDTITKAALRGGKMVKSLLGFARQSPAEERELDVNEVLREEVRLLERTTLSKVRLEMDLASDLRPIRGDESALTHAFMNLCVNAVDAMPEHGTLTLRTQNVDHDWIEVVVADTGTGMPTEVLEKALDPFFTTKGTGKGTGLGLPLVFSTVKAHRGHLEIQSEVGRGTHIRMRFPACVPAGEATQPVAERRLLPTTGPLRVLLVDDDELVRGSIQVPLDLLGHTTTLACSGEEALAHLEAGLQPDVMMLDINMPGLGGAGTLPRLRALRPILPVILITGRSDQTALELAGAHPHVSLLSKPFSIKELQGQLEALGNS